MRLSAAIPSQFLSHNVVVYPLLNAQGYGYIPPPPSEREAVWTDQVWGASVPTNRKIFCNRSLNMRQIKVRVRYKSQQQEWGV
jgi:hypothetical protein